MPETTQADASIAMYRRREETRLRRQRAGSREGRLAAVDNPGESEAAWQPVAAATEQLDWREPA